jgi:hypothetical protein
MAAIGIFSLLTPVWIQAANGIIPLGPVSIERLRLFMTRNRPNQAMQVTAGRFMPRHFAISARPLQFTLAPASRT